MIKDASSDTRDWLAVWLLMAVSLALLLPRLGSNRLNGEEATIAMLAQSVLEHGYPLAETKRGLVTQEWGYDSNRYGVWIITPWLPIYLCALSFKILGVSPLAARLPFALAGAVGAILLFAAARRMLCSRGWSFLTALLLVGNVQFLLFCRRVGPHGLAILLAVLILLECLRLRCSRQAHGNQPKTSLRIGLWSGILFHVDYWIWMLQTASLLAYWLHLLWTNRPSGKEKTDITFIYRSVALATTGSICIALPFLAYVACTGGLPIRFLSAHEVPPFYRAMYPIGGVWEALQYLLGPLVILYALRFLSTRNRPSYEKDTMLLWLFMLGTLLAYVVLIKVIALPSRYMYACHLMPALTLLSVVWLRDVAKRSKMLTVAVVFLLWFTNLGEVWLPWLGQLGESNRHFVPPKWKSYQVEYVKELWQVYKGPVDRLVDYMNEHRKRLKTLFASYEVEPLMFHLETVPVREIPLPVLPDLIVLRAGWTCDYDRVLVASTWKPLEGRNYRVSWQRAVSAKNIEAHCAYMNRFIKVSNYKYVVLPSADQWQQNSDETRTRYFCPDDDLRKVDLWLRNGL